MFNPQTQLSTRQHAESIIRTLRENGHVAYLAGGCVRDLILGHEPKDYDVATDAPPERVKKLFKRTQAVGQNFGVVIVRSGDDVVEVATFRSDGDYDDGRRPSSVSFTTAEHDARRRDFTINGLFLDIHVDGSGDDILSETVVDYVGGQEDIRLRIIRAIGRAEDRFAEDHLRMLRAVRFAARFGFAIEENTSRAIQSNAHKLARISPERIGDELRRMLASDSRAVARDLLSELGLLSVIFRHVPHGTLQSTMTASPAHSVDSLLAKLSPRNVGDEDGGLPLGLSLAAVWLDQQEDIPAALNEASIHAAARGLRQTLRLSNDEFDAFVGTVSFAPLLNEEPSVARLKRFLACAHADSALRLLSELRLDGSIEMTRRKLVERLVELKRENDFAPMPLITGLDLIGRGHTPGPMFKRVLDSAYDAQLEHRVASKDEALTLAEELLRIT